MNLEPLDVEYEFSDGWGPMGFGRVIDHHDSNGHRIVVDDNGYEQDIDEHDWGPDFSQPHGEQEVDSQHDCIEDCDEYDCASSTSSWGSDCPMDVLEDLSLELD